MSSRQKILEMDYMISWNWLHLTNEQLMKIK